jgi:hypothetical protein
MDKEQKNLKVFGYGLGVILGFIAWRIMAKHGVGFWPGFLALSGMALTFVTALDYRFLRPVYSRWMIAAHFIGMIITTAVLSALFFVVFGLVGIVLRLLRKDILSQKIEKEKESYWIKRDKEAFNRARYTQQF